MGKVKNITIDLLASGFRSGYAPVASGTFGTMVAIPFVIALRSCVSEIVFVAATLVLTVCSFYIAHEAERLYEENDSSKIVIDEIAGFFVTCLFMPVLRWDVIVVAFLVFRFFDIAKLWPASYFDKKTGGVAVIMDDVAAGIYACICVHIYVYLTVLSGIFNKVSQVSPN